MNGYGASAYQRVQTTLGPRQLEAHLLLKAAAQLQSFKDNWSYDAEAVAEALTLNRKLWTILGTSATEDSNPLSAELKENIGNLTVFVLKRTLEIMDDPSPEKLSALITINRSLAQGLRGQGDEE
ncbi:Flagellar FlaF family protein [uncultured Pleomorphomonas sp.]|uniref:Flagellar FlaF family protein n=1 Tax=uncultured Pleomorphomonas sp. TaxID=442121 RepID=A0A212L4Z2_9HYPH|nr:flagellar biosynthesis regulator FlaF [uncultured Pleomorphomonas sp.]SCM72642.1 Flagellar FlaF family protein [uncultured Pleomorphomonas sp.]